MIGSWAMALCQRCHKKLRCLRSYTSYISKSVHNSTHYRSRNLAISSDSLHVSEEVAHALHSGSPVVALETTIITHGMPYPENLRMATEVESLIRAKSVTPASIGILRGNLHIGLNKSQLGYLADPGTKSVKTSRRDFPYVMSQLWKPEMPMNDDFCSAYFGGMRSSKLNGGTTVSGTMVAAHLAGIQVFVTGGIGGVHRGAERSMDISADLTELGRTPVTVVSAGVKSILDIGRTLEYLETQGVCVATYSDSPEFPAFFTRHSGYRAPYHIENPEKAAKLIDASLRLGLQSGTLIAVPIPEEFEAEGEIIEAAVQESIQAGLVGKEVTPFILQSVNELTEGKSLQANIQLVKNNARVGSDIAIALSRLQQVSSERKPETKRDNGRRGQPSKSKQQKTAGGLSDSHNEVVVIGGSIVDFYARLKEKDLQLNGATYPGTVQQLFGGVGRNVADCLSRLGVSPLFISAIGNDSHRAPFQGHCKHMDLSGVAILDDISTATYFAILQHTGGLLFGVGDMEIHSRITPEYISSFEKEILSSSLVCMDGNITVEAVEYVCQLCQTHQIPLWFEPTDMNKASKPFQTSVSSPVTFASPNLNELRNIASYLCDSSHVNSGNADDLERDSIVEESVQLLKIVGEHIPVVIVTLGKHGAILCRHGDRLGKLPVRGQSLQAGGPIVMEHYPTCMPGQEPTSVVSVSGAGDCMTAAIISGILQGHNPAMCMRMGLMAASVSLQSCQTVPTDFHPSLVTPEVVREKTDVKPQLLLQK